MLKSFHFERENANRNLKLVFETFGKYLLGTTYDTFLNYLNKEKYDISKLKLPPYILIALKLLDAIRLACDRLHARRPNASWTLTAIPSLSAARSIPACTAEPLSTSTLSTATEIAALPAVLTTFRRFVTVNPSAVRLRLNPTSTPMTMTIFWRKEG